MPRIKGITYATRIERICEWCGVSFFITPGDLNKHQCRFCGPKCAIAGRTRAHILPLEQRFWNKVAKTDDADSCWLFTGATNTGGYGHLKGVKTVIAAHVLAWEFASGEPVPEGMSVLHVCDVRRCIRNDDAGIYLVNGIERPRFGHLFIGTHEDNMRDCVAKGRFISPLKFNPKLAARGEKNGSITHPERLKRGEDAGSAKLTEDRIREIRRLYTTGDISQAMLGKRFGVSHSVIGDIVRKESWRHVQDESPDTN
jgi:hypothetical protein